MYVFLTLMALPEEGTNKNFQSMIATRQAKPRGASVESSFVESNKSSSVLPNSYQVLLSRTSSDRWRISSVDARMSSCTRESRPSQVHYPWTDALATVLQEVQSLWSHPPNTLCLYLRQKQVSLEDHRPCSLRHRWSGQMFVRTATLLKEHL